MSVRGLELLWQKADQLYFKEHPDRNFHIRKAYKDEMRGEYWSLGEHDINRRVIILCRVDHEMKPLPDHKVMKLPVLLFADETVEDTDDNLFPIVRDIMLDALKRGSKK